MVTLYSSSGQAVAYVDHDGQSIYLYDGRPVAWLSDESVFAYSGRYLGWVDNGWFYDRNGRPAFFTEDSTGGPARPARSARPARGARGARPARGAREARPAKPARSLSWSELSGNAFFEQ
ncbi:4-fold beta flower protein [Marinobacter salarius]|uniref:4-fold beta flower protein n=1 Tax=Marinobacter salarius TaxID=1420917 RepID=UPI0034DD1982